MNFFLENPVALGVTGFLFVVGAAVGWLQTGKKPALVAFCGSIILTIFAIAISLAIETDQEKIRSFVYDGANEVERNQVEKALTRIHPSASETLSRAGAELHRFDFSMVRILSFYDLVIDPNTVPPTATVSIDVFAEGRFGGNVGKGSRTFDLKLRRDDQTWKVYDYSERPFALSQ